MNEMIERGRNALKSKIVSSALRDQDYDAAVIAIIKALREPTEAMIGAALVQPYPTVQEAGGLMEQAHAAAKLEWQAMIDEILK